MAYYNYVCSLTVSIPTLCIYVCTVQLTAKFTTRVVFLRVYFEALVKTRMPHESDPIARVGLVHASLNFLDSIQQYFTCLIMKLTNRTLTPLNMQISTYSVCPNPP